MLKRVKIQGYRSLADVEVHLQPLTVLFGPNASGKSNFLDALQLLSRIATSESLRYAFAHPYRGKIIESFTFGPEGLEGLHTQESVSFSIEVDVELSQAIVDAINRQFQAMGGTETIREKYVRYRIEIEFLPNAAILRVADEYLAALDANDELIKQAPLLEKSSSVLRLDGHEQPILYKLDQQSIFLMPLYLARSPYLLAIQEELANWDFYYLEPRERMRIPTPVKEVRHIGLMGEELDAFFNTLRVLDEPQFRAVEKALHMIIPSITGIDVSIDNSGDVDLKLMQGQTPIPSRLLSDGTLRVLGLLALAAAKDKPTLLGFEEPENGIHPGSISLIVLLLETRAWLNTQIIVTTHSPILIDLIPHKSLFVCRKPGWRTMIEPFSVWEYPDVNEVLDDFPELTVSERLLRGDFNAEN